MKIKRRFFLSILIVIGGILMAGVVKFIFDAPFRNKIPAKPDFETVSKPLQQQISAASFKAKLNPSADNFGQLGMVYHSCANYEKATQCYKLAIERNIKKWIWSYYLGHLNLQQGDYEMAVENFESVVENSAKNKMALYYLGDAYQSLNRNDLAEKYFKMVAAMRDSGSEIGETGRKNYFPLPTYAQFNLARIYMNTDRLEEAEKMVKQIIQEQITFGPAYRLLGNIYARKGDLKVSSHYAVRANDLAEFTPPVDLLMDRLIFISRSELYLLKEIDIAVNNRNLEWALSLCKHAMKYIPDNKFLIYKTIRGYLALNDVSPAKAIAEQHLKNFGDDYEEMMKMADLFVGKGLKTEAMMFFNQAKKLKAASPFLSVWLGKNGFDQEAYQLMKEQLAKEPESKEFVSNAVMISMDRGEKEMVKAYLDKLKKIAPTSLDVKRYEGYLAEEEGRLDDVISSWMEVFKSDPRDFFIIDNLVGIFIKNKMWKRASQFLQQALESNPNDPFLLDEMSKLLLYCPEEKFRNIEQGREYAERAYISIGSDVNTKMLAAQNLVKAYTELGDQPRAEACRKILMNLAGKVGN